VSAGQAVAAVLRAQGSARVVDVDELLQRQALDVIARVGFGMDLEATKVN
jgi:hypothetical protein